VVCTSGFCASRHVLGSLLSLYPSPPLGAEERGFIFFVFLPRVAPQGTVSGATPGLSDGTHVGVLSLGYGGTRPYRGKVRLLTSSATTSGLTPGPATISSKLEPRTCAERGCSGRVSGF